MKPKQAVRSSVTRHHMRKQWNLYRQMVAAGRESDARFVRHMLREDIAIEREAIFSRARSVATESGRLADYIRPKIQA